MRFVFIDRIEEIEKNKYAKGIKAISFEEGLLKSPSYEKGSFPPLLLLESAAQLASWLIMYSSDFKLIPMIAKMEKVSVFGNVKSGDILNIELNIISMNEEGALLNAEIFSSGRLVTKGENCLCVFAELEKFVDPAEMAAMFSDISKNAKFHGGEEELQ
ncbi:MAG: hypothetical protein KAT34_13045 [Candidatus Aminicenantes bacterium]|nr:hypothetical protein [Candidatus Aminicenantes bacterium]